ncbi:MAG: type secretion system protein GspE [Pseudomonadota bacterium]
MSDLSPHSDVLGETQSLAPQGVDRLPFSFARDKKVLLLRQHGEAVMQYVAPLQLGVLAEVQRAAGELVQLHELPVAAFDQALRSAYQSSDNEAAQAAEDLGADIDLSRLVSEIPESSELMDGDDDAPVIRLINAILSQAVRENASDIHVETFEDNLIVRFRVDGVLREVLTPKRQLAPLIVSRLKVMAKLDIAEKRVPQDGRISVKLAGHAVDIRLSTMPSAHGERIVLRLLDKQAGQLSLPQLNMGAQTVADYDRCLNAPHGIVLVTGPTGSGKTTTLYAGLTHINQSSRNILTIEDPIEYMLRGIGQTQVNTKVDMTFARGLRAILRQDPDVVMVGEIRDAETAQIAVQASLTGHLVLSTLHTNTAIGAVTRLQDMGIEPFLLSSSVLGLLAQRLVRLLCKECKVPYQATEVELQKLQLPAGSQVTLHKPGECRHCNHTGYRGRTGIYELVMVDDTMRHLIHDQASEQDMESYARQHSPSLYQDGCDRAIRGDTSLEELLRVTAVA